MAITIPIQPHNSQAGIQVARGGPVAQYRSDSAFVTPRQSAMPSALNHLAKGIDKLGGVIFDAEIRKRQEALDIEAMQDVQAAMLQDNQWMADYEEQHKGLAAQDAATVYEAHADKLTALLVRKYQHNPRALEYVTSRLGSMKVSGSQSMRGYEEKQQSFSLSALAEQKGLWLSSLARNPDTTPEQFAQGMQDYSLAQRQAYIRQGYTPQEATVKAGEDLRAMNKERLKNQLASMQMNNPLAGLSMVDAAMTGGGVSGLSLRLPEDAAGMAAKEAQSRGVDPGLILAVMAQESGGNPNAVSKAGARGYMQIMPATQKELEGRYGISGDTPEGNIALGVAYFKELLDKYGNDEQLALMAYNWGPGNVDAFLKTGKGKYGQEMPEETRRYVPAVFSKAQKVDAAEIQARELRNTMTPPELLDLRSAFERTLAARGKQQEEAFKVIRAEAEKDIYAKAYDKTLTRADVESARDLLAPEDYFKALKLIDGETSLPDKSDPEALILLQGMAVAGDPALQETANDLLRGGRLTNGDYSKMLNEGQQWRKPVIRQADEILRLKTGYSDLNPNPDAGSSYLMARDDFQTWLDSDEGKKAGDEEKIRMANRVGDNYRISQAESLLSVPVPLFLVGSRTMPDIQKTAEATQKAHAEGRLSDTEYAEQARRIKRMADILERQTQETSSTKENRR